MWICWFHSFNPVLFACCSILPTKVPPSLTSALIFNSMLFQLWSANTTVLSSHNVVVPLGFKITRVYWQYRRIDTAIICFFPFHVHRHVFARPSGKRCLVVSSNGMTISRVRNGSILHRFPSALPNGSKRDISGPASSFSILDCIFHEVTQTNRFIFHLLQASWFWTYLFPYSCL